ncbi:MAG: zinc metallopeptidase [Candidatus Margulisiibacteriota bacterium]
MFYFDPTFLLLIPAILVTLYAQYRVQATFAKYSSVQAKSGRTAGQVARLILDEVGLASIPINQVAGNLTDNYDPRDKTLHLSEPVYNSTSVAAIGVAAHEAGHAIQDAKAYAPLALRRNLVPVAGLGSQLAIPLFFMGMIFSMPILMDVGIIAFSLAVAFTAITLPVEFNASARAIKVLSGHGYLTEDEVPMARSVLNAAALTYLASAAMAVMNLLRLIILRGQRD